MASEMVASAGEAPAEPHARERSVAGLAVLVGRLDRLDGSVPTCAMWWLHRAALCGALQAAFSAAMSMHRVQEETFRIRVREQFPNLMPVLKAFTARSAGSPLCRDLVLLLNQLRALGAEPEDADADTVGEWCVAKAALSRALITELESQSRGWRLASVNSRHTATKMIRRHERAQYADSEDDS
jgi:hypothetical protein